ncbi:EGF-like repeat and discoidin I-like domain-containing protein 3 [Stylophora pistillata]|uniref:EGF-like repeat and discoidin I-like domain-containing protein 3 n=1 Tax=Stylophora pistillata TaxID=50429 RepID=A0A2B4S723_STYPI|nr:EGF-like repeat and discoidin I-like domain-containing protein 3 [Stylophora pistillata]
MERGIIRDVRITASSQWDANHAAVNARLHFKVGGGKQGAWSAAANNQSQWLKVNLGSETDIRIIGTQRRNGYSQWVTSFKLDYNNDESSFQHYRDAGSSRDKLFAANNDRDTVVNHKLTFPMKVRYIRVIPWTWPNHISMRMELYGYSVCSLSLGMESRAISDAQISASSQWDASHAAIQGRLIFQAGGGKEGGWSARANNQNQWLQADLGSVKKVTHLATQGRNAASQWVKSYMVEYSDDGSTFHVYKEQGTNFDRVVWILICKYLYGLS